MKPCFLLNDLSREHKIVTQELVAQQEITQSYFKQKHLFYIEI